jgi:hypothetical protein
MTRAADLAKLIAGSSTLGGTGELVLKDIDTADGSSPKITFQTGDTDIASADVLGTIDFQAPDEGTGTDALLVAAGIEAVSEGDFSSSSNATSLVFKTGSSEAATEKGRLDSSGRLNVGQTSAYAPTGGGVSMATFEEGSDSRTNLVVSNQNSGSSAGSAIALAVHGADYIIEGQGSGKGGGLTFTKSDSVRMTIDTNGHVTMPLQSCFFAKKNSDTANVAVNSAVAVVFDSEIFDQNNDFDTSNGTFTAPITGRYQLNATLYVGSMPNDANYCLMEIVASNRNHMDIFRSQAGDEEWTYHSFKLATLMDMDAGDTAKVNFYMPNGTQSVDITGNSTHSHTSFSGCLLA